MEGKGGSVLSLQFDPTTSGITIGSRRPSSRGPTRRPAAGSASSIRSASITRRRSATVEYNAHGRRTVWVTFRCWRSRSRGYGKHVDDDTLAEGWYLDPYGVHQQRWISEGRPSNLVRDGDQESKDEPPDRPPSHPYVEIPFNSADSPGRSDLRRADDIQLQAVIKPRMYGNSVLDGMLVLPNAARPLGRTVPPPIEQPFERKLRHQARKETLEATVEPLVRKGGALPQITKPGPTRLFTRPDLPERDTFPLVGGRHSAVYANVSIGRLVARARGLREHHQNAEVRDPTRG